MGGGRSYFLVCFYMTRFGRFRGLGFAAALLFWWPPALAAQSAPDEVPPHLLRELDFPEGASLDSYKEATRQLGRMKARKAVPRLTEIVEKEGDKWRRLWAIKALGQIGDPAALPALEREARDPKPDPNSWWREVDIAAECRAAIAAIREADAPLPLPPLRRPSGCVDPAGGRVAVVSKSPERAAAWLEFLSASGYEAWRDDGVAASSADLVVLASDFEHLSGFERRKILAVGEEARRFFSARDIYPGGTTWHTSSRLPKAVESLRAQGTFADLRETPCPLADPGGGIVLHDGSKALNHYSVPDDGGFPGHIVGIIRDSAGSWAALQEENVVIWGYETSFHTMTPEGQRLLVNLIQALIKAPAFEPSTRPLLSPGQPYSGEIVGGRRQVFRVRPEGHASWAEASWSCGVQMLLFEGRPTEGVRGPSPLRLTMDRYHEGAEEALLELDPFGLAEGATCRFSVTVERVMLLRSPRAQHEPPRIPPLGTSSVLLSAAALAFAAYASGRGLRVNAGKAANLAVLLGVFGALAGYVGGLNTGRVQEAGILLAAGLFAAGAGRTGLAYRGTRMPLFAGGAALTAAVVAAMAVLSRGG